MRQGQGLRQRTGRGGIHINIQEKRCGSQENTKRGINIKIDERLCDRGEGIARKREEGLFTLIYKRGSVEGVRAQPEKNMTGVLTSIYTRGSVVGARV